MEYLIFWIICILAFWGLIDLLMAYKFSKGEGVDKSASLWNWFNLKWCLASQTTRIIKALPFISKDLSVVVGLKK